MWPIVRRAIVWIVLLIVSHSPGQDAKWTDNLAKTLDPSQGLQRWLGPKQLLYIHIQDPQTLLGITNTDLKDHNFGYYVKLNGDSTDIAGYNNVLILPYNGKPETELLLTIKLKAKNEIRAEPSWAGYDLENICPVSELNTNTQEIASIRSFVLNDFALAPDDNPTTSNVNIMSRIVPEGSKVIKKLTVKISLEATTPGVELGTNAKITLRLLPTKTYERTKAYEIRTLFAFDYIYGDVEQIQTLEITLESDSTPQVYKTISFDQVMGRGEGVQAGISMDRDDDDDGQGGFIVKVDEYVRIRVTVYTREAGTKSQTKMATLRGYPDQGEIIKIQDIRGEVADDCEELETSLLRQVPQKYKRKGKKWNYHSAITVGVDAEADVVRITQPWRTDGGPSKEFTKDILIKDLRGRGGKPKSYYLHRQTSASIDDLLIRVALEEYEDIFKN